MSNKARKERKRAGIKFERTQKVGTPLHERAIPFRKDQRTGAIGPSNRAIRKLAERIVMAEKYAQKEEEDVD